MTTARIAYAGISDRGNARFRNEDYIAFHLPDDDEVERLKGSLFVVCDGVGGSGAGDVASKEGAEMLLRQYYASKRPPARALRDAFTRANAHVYDVQLTNASALRMQTTLSAIVLHGRELHLAHIGDSRIYRLRQPTPGVGDADESALIVSQLSTDHSEVADLARLQIIAPDMIRKHPRRNIITRSLGHQPVVRGQFASLPVAAGDIFLICSDGLWEPVEERDMANIVGQNDLEEACRRLVALAIELEVRDNVSVQLVQVRQLPPAEDNQDTARRPTFLQRLLGR